MKLYTQYCTFLKDNLTDDFTLSKAWFTTFTLSPEFFESYLLPPLVGENEQRPKTYADFEEINAKLQNLPKKAIKVFYDIKMPIDGLKKTTVDFIGVQHQSGLFHPKLTYLEFTNSDQTRAFVMVGSANIGVAGWGVNRESVVIEEVTTKTQFEQIKSFFWGIDVELTKPKYLNLIVHDDYKDWFLIHSNPKSKSFITQINNLSQSAWKVWSPYFSTKLNDLVGEFPNAEISLIPDLVENQRIRLKELPDDVTFHQDKGPSENQTFTHAKVWLSPDYLIIGSHNFTRPALTHQNYEVSLCQPIEGLFDQVELSSAGQIESMSESDLDEESLPEMEDVIPLHLTADWENKTLTLKPLNLEKDISLDLLLPGLKDRIIVNHTPKEPLDLSGIVLAHFFNGLIVNKLAIAFRTDEEKPYAKGFICEKNTKYRQPFSYDNLQDLMFDNLTSKTIPTSSRLKHLAELKGGNDAESTFDEAIKITIDFFHIFSFFKSMEDKIENNKKEKDPRDFIFFAPDGINAVKGLIENVMNDVLDPELTLIHYFIVREFNELLKKNTKKGLDPLLQRFELNGKQDKFVNSVYTAKGFS